MPFRLLRSTQTTFFKSRLIPVPIKRVGVFNFSSCESLFQASHVSANDLAPHLNLLKSKEMSISTKSPEVTALLARLKLNFSQPELITQVLHYNSTYSNFPSNERLRYLGTYFYLL